MRRRRPNFRDQAVKSLKICKSETETLESAFPKLSTVLKSIDPLSRNLNHKNDPQINTFTRFATSAISLEKQCDG